MDSSGISEISSRLPARFVPELQRASRRLDLPEELKREILLEMAADLESLAERLRADGFGAADADREAIRRLGLGKDASSALSDLHLGPLERAIRRGAALARTGRDLTLLGAGIILALSTLPILGRNMDPGRVAGEFWPVGALLVLALWSAGQVGSALTAESLDPGRAWEGLIRLLLAVALTFSTAALIASLHVFREARLRSAANDAFGRGLIEVAGGASARLGIGMAVGLAMLAVWTVLASRLIGRINAEAPASEIFHNPARRDQ